MEIRVDTLVQPNTKMDQRLTQLEDMIQRKSSILVPVKKSSVNSFADSPFVDAINMVEMPRKSNLLMMKMFDGTTNLDDHIAQYKQNILRAVIPHKLRKACMCNGFGSSLSGPAL